MLGFCLLCKEQNIYSFTHTHIYVYMYVQNQIKKLRSELEVFAGILVSGVSHQSQKKIMRIIKKRIILN